MKKITIAYIGGGSKAWAHTYFADLLTQDKLEGELRLYDIDVKAARRNQTYFNELHKNSPEKIKSAWACTVESDIGRALSGADFVVISILPYSLRNMKVDVHYPERYGIWQSVGDSAGAGGYSRALRTIPSYIHFARQIREHCPDAWVINYTNPMSMCMNTLYRAFPDIKAFGCCHEVFGTQNLLCRVAGMYLALSEDGRKAFLASDLKAVKAELAALGKDFNEIKKFGAGFGRKDISTNVQGVNHFTWINKASHDGLDLLEIYAAYIKMFRENNIERLKSKTAVKQRFLNEQNVKYALFERTGAAAAAGDRHLAEFVPELYLTSRHVLKYGFELTPVWGRILASHVLKAGIILSATPLRKPKIKGSGEEGVKQMTAICGLGDIVTNVNLPNTGQLSNVVRGTAVETNAAFSLDSVVALDAGEMSPETAALTNIHAQNQKDFVEAFFNKDLPALEEIFCRDPQVARIGREKGKKLFAEMRKKNEKCLEDFLK